jgi:hypothetical protein
MECEEKEKNMQEDHLHPCGTKMFNPWSDLEVWYPCNGLSTAVKVSENLQQWHPWLFCLLICKPST